jgi:hypothetical protein
LGDVAKKSIFTFGSGRLALYAPVIVGLMCFGSGSTHGVDARGRSHGPAAWMRHISEDWVTVDASGMRGRRSSMYRRSIRSWKLLERMAPMEVASKVAPTLLPAGECIDSQGLGGVWRWSRFAVGVLLRVKRGWGKNQSPPGFRPPSTCKGAGVRLEQQHSRCSAPQFGRPSRSTGWIHACHGRFYDPALDLNRGGSDVKWRWRAIEAWRTRGRGGQEGRSRRGDGMDAAGDCATRDLGRFSRCTTRGGGED